MDKWISFDDVVYCEYFNGYNIIQTYFDAVQDDGSENIYGCIGCEIEVCESTDCKDYEHKIIKGLYRVLKNEGENPEMWDAISYVCAPRDHKNISMYNESSYDDTQRIVNRIKDYLTA